MVSIQNLEIELQELFKQQKYSEIVFEITTKTNENERSSGLLNMLGISRITNNKKNKDIVSLAVKDFKQGYLLEKNTVNSLDCLANFIISSALLRDLESKDNFNFDEIISFYKDVEKFSLNHRAIDSTSIKAIHTLTSYTTGCSSYFILLKSIHYLIIIVRLHMSQAGH